MIPVYRVSPTLRVPSQVADILLEHHREYHLPGAMAICSESPCYQLRAACDRDPVVRFVCEDCGVERDDEYDDDDDD